MKRTLDVMVVPVGREPEFKTLEADENGSFLKALQEMCIRDRLYTLIFELSA